MVLTKWLALHSLLKQCATWFSHTKQQNYEKFSIDWFIINGIDELWCCKQNNLWNN